MTAFYTGFVVAEQEEKSLKTIARALELGLNFFDTAWVYQSFGVDGQPNRTNEELLGKAIKIHGRDKFIIATKFGFIPTATGLTLSGKPDLIRSQLADSLQRLGTDYIDLYYQHRMDPSTPIEETMECLKQLVQEGKIRYVGLSECTPSELRRAHAVHPVTAIQMEYSLQSRDIEAEVIPTARELGVGIVAYSPLGRGFLSATFTSRDQLAENDWRRNQPRFSEENFAKNVQTRFFEHAAKKGCTPGQLALAWVHAQGEDIFPIPGTKDSSRLEENLRAVSIKLSPEEAKEVGELVECTAGDRYAGMSSTFNSRLNL